MVYKIRVILNTKEDIIRDIAIHSTDTLEDLHNAITNAFDFEGNEMASFYKSDNDWVQGEEFPLFDMSDGSTGVAQMQDITLDEVIANNEDKLIYVYDFLSMWSFYVEVIDNDLTDLPMEPPCLLFSLGIVPNSAPDIAFESEDLSKDGFEDDDEEDDFDEFDFENFDEVY